MNRGYFVTGIGTEVGKTVVSAVLTQALGALYWKPIQSGDLDHTDTDKVKNLVSNTAVRFWPERFRLNTPASPHLAAAIDQVQIDLDDFQLPESDQPLIVEGAGGLHVPLNDSQLMIDLIHRLGLEVVLVSQHYLGSINHSLLSWEALVSRNLPVVGWVFTGPSNSDSEQIILKHSGLPVLGRVPQLEPLNQETVAVAAQSFKSLTA